MNNSGEYLVEQTQCLPDMVHKKWRYAEMHCSINKQNYAKLFKYLLTSGEGFCVKLFKKRLMVTVI